MKLRSLCLKTRPCFYILFPFLLFLMMPYLTMQIKGHNVMLKKQLQLKTVQLDISLGQRLQRSPQQWPPKQRLFNAFTPFISKHSISRMRPSTANSQQSKNKVQPIPIKQGKRKLTIQHSKAMSKFKQIEVQGKLVEEFLPQKRGSKTRFNTQQSQRTTKKISYRCSKPPNHCRVLTEPSQALSSFYLQLREVQQSQRRSESYRNDMNQTLRGSTMNSFKHNHRPMTGVPYRRKAMSLAGLDGKKKHDPLMPTPWDAKDNEEAQQIQGF